MTSNSNLVTVAFRNHVMPDEQASKKAGRPIFTEMEVCDIAFAANTKTKATFPAHDAEPNATRESVATGGGVVTYAMLYNDQYLAFKRGEAQPMSGTPLSEAPFLKESRRRELKALNIHTVEALAALDGTPLKQIGMGGRELKNQAQAYLDAAAGSADVTALASENEILRTQLAEQRKLIDEYIVAGQKSREQQAVETAAEQDISDEARQQAKVDLAAAKRPIKAGESTDFDAWNDDKLRDYIAQESGQRPRGNPSHNTLVAAAKELAAG